MRFTIAAVTLMLTILVAAPTKAEPMKILLDWFINPDPCTFRLPPVCRSAGSAP